MHTAACELSADAFFHSGGTRWSNTGVTTWTCATRRRLSTSTRRSASSSGDLGIGYLKVDYNTRVDPGVGADGVSPGAGLLGHMRTLLDWLDRHPGLTIENCASGGMRTDYAMLSQLQVQSTSDQEDPLPGAGRRLGLSAAGAERRAEHLTLCGVLLGCIHLSGHLDQSSLAQQALVAEAVSVYKSIRADLARDGAILAAWTAAGDGLLGIARPARCGPGLPAGLDAGGRSVRPERQAVTPAWSGPLAHPAWSSRVTRRRPACPSPARSVRRSGSRFSSLSRARACPVGAGQR